MKKYVLIVAGGQGIRMGGDLPKQFIPLAGKPVLMHTLEAFYRWDKTARICVVLPFEHQAYWKMLCREIGCKVPHLIADGGKTRFHSVQHGLKSLVEEESLFTDSDKCRVENNSESLVAIHDGVRPFVTTEMINRCFHEAEHCGAAIPVVTVIDSLREVKGQSSHPVDRSRFVAVQTPQVFDLDLLLKAYCVPFSPLFTDDASVVESFGHSIAMVEGCRENIKITTPFDLSVAESLFNTI
ncbi:MAG: 2-C-methyl-D-erythritol 4-phosphate cytidylyltransferase [Parabacteroides sp.]|nr:2-C-methyl-D-erythritol 4-phosphate cytidylyltransferase [Parabacteroides sp.]